MWFCRECLERYGRTTLVADASFAGTRLCANGDVALALLGPVPKYSSLEANGSSMRCICLAKLASTDDSGTVRLVQLALATPEHEIFASKPQQTPEGAVFAIAPAEEAVGLAALRSIASAKPNAASVIEGLSDRIADRIGNA